MGIHNEKQAITALLNSFAATLTSSNTAQIPTFFTEDALFMPESTRSFSGEDIKRQTGGFFAKVAFSITFSIKEVTIDGTYAFVHATAATNTLFRTTGIVIEKMTRDFFVLRKSGEDWKIYRYMFTRVKRQTI